MQTTVFYLLTFDFELEANTQIYFTARMRVVQLFVTTLMPVVNVKRGNEYIFLIFL